MRDDGSAAVELRDLPEVDCEGQRDLLALAQTEVGSLYENSGRAEIDCTADPSPPAGKQNVDGRACAMASMQAAFQAYPQDRCSFFLSAAAYYAAVQASAFGNST